jgi:hypothetical protein
VFIETAGEFKFEMSLDPQEKIQEGITTLPWAFWEWLDKYNNNTDALDFSEQLGPLFDLGMNENVAVMNGPVAIWALCLRQLLGNKDCEDMLRFTSSTTFYNNLKQDPKGQADHIVAKYKCVIITDKFRLGETGRGGYENILDFCALYLIKKQVKIFPPLLLLYALADKHNLQDPPLEEVKLPNVLIGTKKTLSKTAEEASKTLHKKCEGLSVNHLVAKVNYSCSTLGVFFLDRQNNSKVWKARKGGGGDWCNWIRRKWIGGGTNFEIWALRGGITEARMENVQLPGRQLK